MKVGDYFKLCDGNVIQVSSYHGYIVDINGKRHSIEGLVPCISTNNAQEDPLNLPSEEFKVKIENNIWDNNLDEVLAFVRSVTIPFKDKFDNKGNWKPDQNRWSWVINNRCKYIGLRIDMRDGGFILADRDKQRISFEQLKWQYNHERDKNICCHYSGPPFEKCEKCGGRNSI